MHLVKIEAAGAQPVRAGHRALLHHRRDRQHRQDLRGEEDTLPVLAQRLAQDPLAAPKPIDLRGVEQGDTQLQRPPHDGLCNLVGVAVAVSPFPGPELPGAQPDLGDLLAGVDAQITHGTSVHPTAAAAPAGHRHGRSRHRPAHSANGRDVAGRVRLLADYTRSARGRHAGGLGCLGRRGQPERARRDRGRAMTRAVVGWLFTLGRAGGSPACSVKGSRLRSKKALTHVHCVTVARRFALSGRPSGLVGVVATARALRGAHDG